MYVEKLITQIKHCYNRSKLFISYDWDRLSRSLRSFNKKVFGGR